MSIDSNDTALQAQAVSMATQDVLLEALAEKIQCQDRFIKGLQAELQLARQSSIDVMLGQLRLREAVLLYVGQDADNFVRKIAENFGSEIAQAVELSVFVLDNAPVLPEVREALRVAANHGMNKW